MISEDTSIKWIDRNTIKNIFYVISNFFLQYNNTSLKYTGLINIPLRLWNAQEAINTKAYWKVAFDVVAFTALFFPMGRKAVILLDYSSEFVNFYLKDNFRIKEVSKEEAGLMNRLKENDMEIKETDCSDRKTALSVLNLTEEEANDQDVLDVKYNELTQEYMKSIKKLKDENPLRHSLYLMINRIERAYDALK